VQELLGDSMDLFSGQFSLPYDESLIACEPDVRPALGGATPFIDGLRTIKARLENPGEIPDIIPGVGK